jgi:DNA polymerase elongation subunit (family B)
LLSQFSSSANLILHKELLAARKQAKKDMKNAGTEFEKSVQNGRQVSSNILEL